MNFKNKLEHLRIELDNQNRLYKPSSFWKENIRKFFVIFKKKGINNFRSNNLANNFFIPLYHLKREKHADKFSKIINKKKKNSPKLTTELFRQLSGFNHALADYRVFRSSDNTNKLPYLHTFSENNVGKPKEQFNFEGKVYSRSSLNYLLGITCLKKITKNFVPRYVLEIGGGFGILGHIFGLSKVINLKYINLDLPPLSLVSEMYLKKIFGKYKVTDSLKEIKKKEIYIKKLKKFSSLPSWKIESLKGKIDLFVNFISFQEMEPYILKNYIKHIFRLKPKYILLRNLREGKQKITEKNPIGVKQQIKTNLYISLLKKNYNLIFQNVVPFGYKTYDNYNSEILIFKKK